MTATTVTVKAPTASQLRTLNRRAIKFSASDMQTLALYRVNPSKENREASQDAIDRIIGKLLQGDWARSPDMALFVLREATGLSAPLFDSLFTGFRGVGEDVDNLVRVLDNPFAELLTRREAAVQALVSAGIDLKKAEQVCGDAAKISKARTAKTAGTTRAKCAAFKVRFAPELGLVAAPAVETGAEVVTA